jgi:uncharacterized glyoxalase superfamily protein PhnB
MMDTSETDVQREKRKPDKPPTLRLKSISPSITVDDLEKSLEWYCNVVGFYLAETFEHEGQIRGAAIKAGRQTLMLSQDDWVKGRDRDKAQGIRLYLQASQDIDEVATAIKARGGDLATEPADMPWGARAFNLVDPDGVHLTITS